MNAILQQIASKAINFLFFCLYLALAVGAIAGSWGLYQYFEEDSSSSDVAKVIAELERLQTDGETDGIDAMIQGLKQSQESSTLAVGRELQLKLEQEAMEMVARMTDYDFRVMTATVTPFNAKGQEKLEDLQAGQRVMYLPQARPQMLGDSLLRYVMVAIPPYNKSDVRWVPVDAVGKSELTAMKVSQGWTKVETPEQIEWWIELAPGQQSPEVLLTAPKNGDVGYDITSNNYQELLWSVNGEQWQKPSDGLSHLSFPAKVKFQTPPWAGPEVVRVKTYNKEVTQ
jgi:hypothetical protein